MVFYSREVKCIKHPNTNKRSRMQCNPALFVLDPAELKYGVENLIYGSLTTRGMRTLSHHIRKQYDPETIQGMDLGCGDGELMYHLQNELPGSQWWGVEICGSRVEKQHRPVFIWEGDMLTESFRDYNVLHADNLCLEEPIAEQLEAKVAREFQGLYITYRKPTTPMFFRNASLLESVPMEATWGVHVVHLYRVG